MTRRRAREEGSDHVASDVPPSLPAPIEAPPSGAVVAPIAPQQDRSVAIRPHRTENDVLVATHALFEPRQEVVPCPEDNAAVPSGYFDPDHILVHVLLKRSPEVLLAAAGAKALWPK